MAFDRQIAAMTLAAEASNASPIERRAIMWVMMNRRNAGRFGLTIAEVCLARYQFSEWLDDLSDNSNLRRVARMHDSDPVMVDCLAAYDDVVAGGADPTRGATHFTDKSIVPPKWTKQAAISLETAKFIFYVGVA